MDKRPYTFLFVCSSLVPCSVQQQHLGTELNIIRLSFNATTQPSQLMNNKLINNHTHPPQPNRSKSHLIPLKQSSSIPSPTRPNPAVFHPKSKSSFTNLCQHSTLHPDDHNVHVLAYPHKAGLRSERVHPFHEPLTHYHR